MDNSRHAEYDLAVIGAGIAGISASVFAANRGLKTVQVGHNSEIGFASGCFDLMGADPMNQGGFCKTPWRAVESVLNKNKKHPYSKLKKDAVVSAFNEFSGFMSSVNLPCKSIKDENQVIITPAGTLKPSYLVPRSMSAGTDAVKQNKKMMIIDIKGLKGFSAVQISQNLKASGVDACSATISFPGKEDNNELNCERMAWDIEMGSALDGFAQRVKAVSQGVDAVGLPAVLGIYNSERVRADIEEKTGRIVFEIPTFSPSVTGLRMKEKLIAKLKDIGVQSYTNTSVKKVDRNENGTFSFVIEQGVSEIHITAKNMILASGRFFSRGLCIKDNRIIESVFNIPVSQPESRDRWYENDFFAKSGHEINRCGLDTDDFFRPLNETGDVYHENLYAIGSILGHQDWKREKSGSGIALSSAYAAMSAISGNVLSVKRNGSTHNVGSENAA